jgi:hypothetical protein
VRTLILTLALVLLRPVYLATPTGVALVCGVFTLAVTFAAATLTWKVVSRV